MRLKSVLCLRDDDVKSSRSARHSSRSSRLSSRSGRSSISAKKAEAAAQIAAHKAELEASKKEAQIEEEISELRHQESLRQARAEASLEKKQKALEQQRIERLLAMESAKYTAYAKELDEAEFAPRLDIGASLNSMKPQTQPRPDSTPQDISSLVETLASSMALNRLPAPEPSVFEGDPLKYNDWCVTFRSLIEERKITEQDKLHYLRRYVSGPARDAISGYLHLRSNDAFQKAKSVLEERYGNPFIVSEAFRDKIENWPKIPSRDSAALRRFSDFLNQCRVAMTEMKSLEILNDSRENRRMLQKLPEWILTRWNRVVFKTK